MIANKTVGIPAVVSKCENNLNSSGYEGLKYCGNSLPISIFIPKRPSLLFISIHSPYTGRDYGNWHLGGQNDISIHSPYTGRDKYTKEQAIEIANFNPLSLYRERRDLSDYAARLQEISIHSPYTGRDVEAGYNVPAILTISIHSPYTGRDGEGEVIGFGVFGFQSTLPIQGETDCNISDNYRNGDFNPLSLYRERR